MGKKKVAVMGSSATLSLAILLMTTNPQSVSVFVMMVPFLLLFAILSSVGWLIFEAYDTEPRRRIVLSAMFAVLPVLLLILKSIGQLEFKDLLIVLAFILFGWFYVSRINFRHEPQ